MAKNSYIAEVEFNLRGIPCLIGVIDYTSVKGSFSYHAPSDLDYRGYEESEWEILDRKGYRAKWLERKIDQDDTEEIEQAISEAMASDY